MGRWFNSKKEVENYTSSERKKWKNKYLNGEITWEEYTKKAPCGYCGNMGRWFNSKKEVENYTSSERKKWKNKYLNGEITWEEYTKKAPCGYECWSCSYCGKWTGNFKYD